LSLPVKASAAANKNAACRLFCWRFKTDSTDAKTFACAACRQQKVARLKIAGFNIVEALKERE